MENRNYSAIYRIMHWAIAFCMIFLLITIFLRLTWMNRDNVANIIQNYLSTKDVTMSRDEIVVLAKQIRKPMWNWHLYTGYVLTGLFCLRLMLPFFGAMKFSNPLKKGLTLKAKFQYWAYLIFYLGLAISLTTGLIIEFGPKTIKKSVEEIHALSLYYLIPFLIIHLGGVMLAEFGNQRGIISRMIRGKNSASSD